MELQSYQKLGFPEFNLDLEKKKTSEIWIRQVDYKRLNKQTSGAKINLQIKYRLINYVKPWSWTNSQRLL